MSSRTFKSISPNWWELCVPSGIYVYVNDKFGLCADPLAPDILPERSHEENLPPFILVIAT